LYSSYCCLHSFPSRRSSDLGVIPGLLLGLLLMVAIYVVARIRNFPRHPRASLKEVLVAGRDSIWGLMLIVIILGGIYGGIFTPRSEEHTSELQSRENLVCRL